MLFSYDPLTPMDASNINSHLLFGVNGKSTLTTMVNGKVVMKDRILLTLDEKEIFEKSREISSKLWSRF